VKQPSPVCNDKPEPLPDCTPFTKPEAADDEAGNGIAPGQAAERCANELGLPVVVPLMARKSPSLDIDSGVDELDLSCDAAAAAAAVLDEVAVPTGHGLPSLTSTGTATRFGGELMAVDELLCWS